MAPKSPAQQPPPAIESSEEMGSGSSSDQSEEEIAPSPHAPVPKNKAALPLQRTEASDDEVEEEVEEGEDEEDEVEEEEEEEETDGEDEEDEVEEEEEEEETDGEDEMDGEEEGVEEEETDSEEEEEEEEETDSEEEEEEETDSEEEEVCSDNDEVRILEVLAAHRQKHGTLPENEGLKAVVDGKLKGADYTLEDIEEKVKNLRSRYTRAVQGVRLPTNGPDRQVFRLSKEVWGGSDKPANNSTVPADFDEMCAMYPYLGDVLKEIKMECPGVFNKEFSMIDKDTARAMDQRFKEEVMKELEVVERGYEVEKKVLKTLMRLIH